MRELTFIEVSEDGSVLLLGSTDGASFSLALDDRLLTAIRRDRSAAKPPMPLDGSSPRDIQNRIRHGQTPQDIQATTDLELERIMRFAGPVLAERAHVADQAQSVSLRDTAYEQTLGAIVTQALAAGGADLGTVEWDAWRRDEVHWSILVSWEPVDAVADGATAALFSYNPTDRTIDSDDPASSWLLGEHHEIEDDSTAAESQSIRPVLVAVPTDDVWDDDNQDADATHTAIIPRDDVTVVGLVDLADRPPLEPTDQSVIDDVYDTLPGLEDPAAKKRRKAARQPRSTRSEAGKGARSRASVPSWDEILFGKGQPDK